MDESTQDKNESNEKEVDSSKSNFGRRMFVQDQVCYKNDDVEKEKYSNKKLVSESSVFLLILTIGLFSLAFFCD